MAQAEDRQELSAGAGCLVLMFTLVWVVVPSALFASWQGDYFAQAVGVFQFIARLATYVLVSGLWAIIGSRVAEGVYRAYRDLHGERFRIALLCPQPKVRIYVVPSGLIMDAPGVSVLHRGERVPTGFTKAGKAMAVGILNVSNVDRVIFNPNLAVVFKEEPSAADIRMVDLAIADALWVYGGKPVTFVDHREINSERSTKKGGK